MINLNKMKTTEDFISPYEAEFLAGDMKKMSLEEYGGDEWMKNHERIDRLNMQAHKNAINSTDEYIMDTFVVKDRVKLKE